MSDAPCPSCGIAYPSNLLACATTLTPGVAGLVRQALPGWSPDRGLCPVCAKTHASHFAARRSHVSLHNSTEPHTTFPYYHAAEESLLSQAERLPDYHTLPAAGVTIAFLDSGYYPHPDLAQAAGWPGDVPAWHLLSQRRWRTLVEEAGLRFVEYADLTDGGETVGLDVPSLWDGAGDSWHGQMTTSTAAGNGRLSGGHYRGYASEASLLAVKIGRGGGRIPEEDILRGLNWLLDEDRWQRYGVRVVNISVGGDFPEEWTTNPVCRAAHALAQRGVFVAAAAGNRGIDELLAPAQTPTVMTVGGVEDHNRRWRPGEIAEVETLSLYHHNTGTVHYQHKPIRKPEILALGRWVPAPVLPPSHVFHEMVAIDRVRRILRGESGDLPDDVRHGLLHDAAEHHEPSAQQVTVDVNHWMPEVWHGLRQRMNAHKWAHPYYQHVDGTSVAVTQVSAVAAQMVQANPNLHGGDIREILLATSLPLPHLLPRQTGPGLLQPARAVAAALRTRGGVLTGYPASGTPLSENELQKWLLRGTFAILAPDKAQEGWPVYFGLWAPGAHSVSLIGTFNRWHPCRLKLEPAANGWWHGALRLPGGMHHYRFWVVDAANPDGYWLRDPENQYTAESGYADAHSLIQLP